MTRHMGDPPQEPWWPAGFLWRFLVMFGLYLVVIAAVVGVVLLVVRP